MLNTVLRNRYKIICSIASGGFGETYLAKDLDLPGHPQCVVKQLKPQSSKPGILNTARRLFETEAQTLYLLGEHSQIPRLLAHFEENNEFYLVQEFIDGWDLRQELISESYGDEIKVINLLQDLLKILDFVHDHNVIHRDIKPSNLMRRNQDQKLVLIDFGAVKKIMLETANSEAVIPSSIAIGTSGYMPPEQTQGKPRFCSDIYAVGMLAIQALTGVLPHQLPENPQTHEIQWRSLLLKNNTQTQLPLLYDILDKMVRYDFRDRYQTVTEVLQDLSGLIDPTPSVKSSFLPNKIREELEYFPSELNNRQTLATIVFTDAVEFSARMSKDEVVTLTLIRRDLHRMRTLCQEFNGFVIKSTGDGLLMYFSSAIQAVNCAIEIQEYLAKTAQNLPENEVLLHRIGIHLGDVFIQDQDVMGNGVNIAARLEGKAQPGGICISQVVYDVVKHNLNVPIRYLGELELKNISEPMPSYLILPTSFSIQTPVKIPVKPVNQSFLKSTSQNNRDRHILLNKVKNFWVKGVLETSLYGRAIIELGLEFRLDLVERPWDILWGTPDDHQQRLSQGTKVSQKFLELGEGRSLLILGEPGSGKTTTLLELAKDLIEHAEQDINQLIPVVFNLSSWKGGKQAITDWLISELNTQYQVSKTLAKRLIESNQLLLLLDGLDEVSLENRENCAIALNQFLQKNGDHEIVVCSRIGDYQALKTRLKLQTAICLQPLTVDQIQDYFNRAGSELTTVKEALKTDLILQELTKSPLMLSIITLAYSGILPSDFLEFSTIEGRRTHLFDTYIKRMFLRRRVNKRYSQEKVIHYLSWLDKNMVKHSQTVFSIESLQLTWLDKSWQKDIYTSLVYLIFNLILCVLFQIILSSVVTLFRDTIQISNDSIIIIFDGLFLGLLNGYILGTIFILLRKRLSNSIGAILLILINGFTQFILWMIISQNSMDFGLIGGLSGGLIGLINLQLINDKIVPTETLKWSWNQAKKSLTKSLFWGLGIGAFIGITYTFITLLNFAFTMTYNSIDESIPTFSFKLAEHPIVLFVFMLINIIVFSLIFEIIGGIIGGILGGLMGTTIENRTIPNQGIFQSLKNAVILSVVSIIFLEIVAKISGFYLPILNGITLGILVGLIGGGGAAIKHFILRCILCLNRSIPWNYAKFLDAAVGWIFLQKIGGSYIFIHRLLLEHFAQLNR